MKTFCILASAVGTFATELPSTRFTDPSHVSVPHPNPKITECSHTTCSFVDRSTSYGVHKVMAIVHDNLESKCAGYTTISTTSGLANHAFYASRKVHCGRIKRWAATSAGTTQATVGHHNGGHWVYDGPCECHVEGSHPNSLQTMELNPTEAPQATAAPVVAGVTEVATTVIDTKLQLPGITVAAFTAAAQEGVVIAIAKQVGVHRSQVALANIGASGGRRLLESAAAGVSFDVVITIKSDAPAASKAMAKITSLATATASNAAERAHFSDVVAEEMVKAVRASPTPPSAAVIETLAAVVVAVEAAPVEATSSVKAGCYTKAKVCPNKPNWVTGDEWRFHSGQTSAGKLSCLSENTSKSHHAACGMNQEQTWHMKWVDNTGSDIMTYPQPGCYFRLNECPKQPGWVTGATHWEADGWKFHQSRTFLGKAACIQTAYGHHLNCGLNARQASESMWIDQDSTTVTQYPEVLELAAVPNQGLVQKVTGTNVASAKNLAACNGECDSDAQCATGLKCFQRGETGLDAIPGCDVSTAPTGDWDYCYDPRWTPTPLKKVSGGNDSSAKNLATCTGECDNDGQCAPGLLCFQRGETGLDAIPGCDVSTAPTGDWDYCYNPNFGKAAPLVKVGKSNDDNAINLKACTGECDSDLQCGPGLKCFQRDNGESIPGCDVSTAPTGTWDYCYDPMFGHTWPVKKVSGGNSASAKGLTACTGECDNDAQCGKGLKCFQRENGEAIPGCDVSTAPSGDWDYCYDPLFGEAGHRFPVTMVGGDNSGSAKGLKACHGECDNDGQCATGLKCFQRENGEGIPGCDVSTAPGKDWDYCYDPKFELNQLLAAEKFTRDNKN